MHLFWLRPPEEQLTETFKHRCQFACHRSSGLELIELLECLPVWRFPAVKARPHPSGSSCGSLVKKGWLPIMMSRRRAGEEELSCWLPLPRESIYGVCNPTEHTTRMPFYSDLCLIVLIYSISAVDWLLNLMWPSLFWWPISVPALGTGWNGMK